MQKMGRMKLLGEQTCWHIFYDTWSMKGKVVKKVMENMEIAYEFNPKTNEILSETPIPLTVQKKMRGLIHTIHKRVGMLR